MRKHFFTPEQTQSYFSELPTPKHVARRPERLLCSTWSETWLLGCHAHFLFEFLVLAAPRGNLTKFAEEPGITATRNPW